MRDWLTVREAAFLVGVAKSTVYRWVESGGLPTMRVGRVLLVSRVGVLEFEASVHLGRPRRVVS